MKTACSPWMLSTAKKTFEAAREVGSELLVQVKGNQPNLLEDIIEKTQDTEPVEADKTVDKTERSRQESRIVETFEPPKTFSDEDWGKLIKTLIRVTRVTRVRSAKDHAWQERKEVSYYVCSAKISARKSAGAIREHWGIENKNHYVRDISMCEDASRIRINAGIFARARSFVLNILRAKGETNIADALWENVLDFTRLQAYRYQRSTLNSPGKCGVGMAHPLLGNLNKLLFHEAFCCLRLFAEA